MRYMVAEAVHPVILQMAQEQPLPAQFTTRAEVVDWLKDQVLMARQALAVTPTGTDDPDRIDRVKRNLAYFEAELLAHSAILEVETGKETSP